jgi:hypothetical protein
MDTLPYFTVDTPEIIYSINDKGEVVPPMPPHSFDDTMKAIASVEEYQRNGGFVGSLKRK